MNTAISKKQENGFTLVEVLLYITLTVITVLVTSTLYSLIMETRLKQDAIARVNGEGELVLRKITQTIRNSTGPTTLTPGTENSTTLSLDMADSNLNPTVFELSEGVLYLTEGTNQPVPLTNSNLFISDLLFRNLGKAGTAGSIRTQFKIETTSTINRSEFLFEKNFYGTASFR